MDTNKNPNSILHTNTVVKLNESVFSRKKTGKRALNADLANIIQKNCVFLNYNKEELKLFLKSEIETKTNEFKKTYIENFEDILRKKCKKQSAEEMRKLQVALEEKLKDDFMFLVMERRKVIKDENKAERDKIKQEKLNKLEESRKQATARMNESNASSMIAFGMLEDSDNESENFELTEEETKELNELLDSLPPILEIEIIPNPVVIKTEIEKSMVSKATKLVDENFLVLISKDGNIKTFCLECARSCQGMSEKEISKTKRSITSFESHKNDIYFNCDCFKADHVPFNSYNNSLNINSVKINPSNELMKSIMKNTESKSFTDFNEYIDQIKCMYLHLQNEGNYLQLKDNCICNKLFQIINMELFIHFEKIYSSTSVSDKDFEFLINYFKQKLDQHRSGSSSKKDDFIIDIKNLGDKDKVDECPFSEIHFPFLFISFFKKILRFLLKEQNRDKSSLSQSIEKKNDIVMNQKKKFYNSGLKLEDFYSYFFYNKHFINFFIEISKDIKSINKDRTTSIFTNHDENKIFIKFSGDLSYIVQSINHIEVNLGIKYPSDIMECFSFNNIFDMFSLEMNESTSSMVIFYQQLALNMFYNIDVLETLHQTSTTHFSNFFSLSFMQRELIYPKFAAFLDNKRVGSIIYSLTDTNKDQYMYLDLLLFILESIEKPFNKYLMMDNKYNKKFISFFGEVFFKMFNCFTNFTVYRYNLINKLSKIFRLITSILCPILYRCLEKVHDSQTYIQQYVETAAINLMIQQNDRISRNLLSGEAVYTTNNKYAFETCSLSCNNIKSILDGLNNKLIVNYCDNFQSIDPLLEELKENILSSYKNSTKNMELAQLLFHDTDLYSNKIKVINKSILPFILSNKEMDSIMSLSFLKLSKDDKDTSLEQYNNDFQYNDIFKIKNQIDSLINDYNYNEGLDYLKQVKDVLSELNRQLVVYLNLEEFTYDYQIYRKKSDFYTLYKRQFILIHIGLLKTLFNLFEVIWLRSKYSTEREIYLQNRSKHVINIKEKSSKNFEEKYSMIHRNTILLKSPKREVQFENIKYSEFELDNLYNKHHISAKDKHKSKDNIKQQDSDDKIHMNDIISSEPNQRHLELNEIKVEPRQLTEENNKFTEYTNVVEIEIYDLLLTQLFQSMEIITLSNPLACNYFCSEKVILHFSLHHHKDLTRFLRNILKTMSIFKFTVNLDFIVKLIINTENTFKEDSDTVLILDIIKYSLRVNDHNIFTLFIPLIENIIQKLNKFVFTKFDLYLLNNLEYTKITSSEKLKDEINIERKFGNFIKNISSSENTKDPDDMEYLEKIIIEYFKILYYVKEPKYFINYIQNHKIGDFTFLEWFAYSNYNMIKEIPPKLNKILIKNINYYLIKKPLNLWCKVEHKDKIKNTLLFWKNEAFKKQNKNHSPEENEKEHNDVFDYNNLTLHGYEIKDPYFKQLQNRINPTMLFKNLLMNQLLKFNNLLLDNQNHYYCTNPKDYMSNFKKTIVYPVYSYIYRTLLFYKEFDTRLTYEMYELIISFLISFAIFLSDLKTIRYDVLEDNQKYKYFKFTSFEELDKKYQEVISDIEILKNTFNPVEDKVNTGAPWTFYEPQNLTENMKYIQKHMEFLKIYRTFNEDKFQGISINANNLENVHSNEIESNRLDLVYNDYFEKKNISENWVLKHIIEDNTDLRNDDYIKLLFEIFMKNLYFDINYYGIDIKSIISTKYLTQKEYEKIEIDKFDNVFKYRLDTQISQEKVAKIKNQFFKESYLFRLVINIITKIISLKPKVFQNLILNDRFFITKIKNHFIPYLDVLYPKDILDGFFDMDVCSNNSYIDVLRDLIEFMRMLCEEHNQLFQAFLLDQYICLFNPWNPSKVCGFLLNIHIDIVNLLENCMPKLEKLKIFREESIQDYFFPLYNVISRYFVEKLQGSFPYNYLAGLGTTLYTQKNGAVVYLYEKWISTNYRLIANFSLNADMFCNYLISFLKVIIAIIEENPSYSSEIINNLTSYGQWYCNSFNKEQQNIKLEQTSQITNSKRVNKKRLPRENKIKKKLSTEDELFDVHKHIPSQNIDDNLENPESDRIDGFYEYDSDNEGNEKDIIKEKSVTKITKKQKEELILSWKTISEQVYPLDSDCHFVLIMQKFNLLQIYEVCKNSLEYAYTKQFNNNNFDFFEAYKESKEFNNSGFLEISFLIFKYMKMVSISQFSVPSGILTSLIENISGSAKSFLDNVSYSKQSSHYKFLDGYTKYIEVVNSVSDEILYSLNYRQNSYLFICKNIITGEEKDENKGFILRSKRMIMQREFFRVPAECWSLMSNKAIIDIANYEDDTDKLLNIVQIIPRIKEMMIKRYSFLMSKNPIIRNYIKFNIKFEDGIVLGSQYLNCLFSVVVNLICFSMLEYEKLGDSKDYFHNVYASHLSLAHLCFLTLYVINWIIFYGVLKLSDISSTYIKQFFFTFNLFFGILAHIGPNFTVCYSFQMFSLISLFDTMQIVIKTLVVRAQQFVFTFALLIIFIWFFSGVAFFYLRQRFILDSVDENVCSSYIRCFVTLINYGMRSLGPWSDPYNPAYDSEIYYPSFVFDWLFYFFVILILLNIVNAIIVDSFQNFREDNSIMVNEQNNVCYLCRINRSDFEIKGFSYENHINKEHNLMDYVFYMINILLLDEYELNSVQSSILKKMNKNQTEFLPFKKAMCLDSD